MVLMRLGQENVRLSHLSQRKHATQGPVRRHRILHQVHPGNQLGHLHERSQPQQAGITHGIPWGSSGTIRILPGDHNIHKTPTQTNSINNRPSIQTQKRLNRKFPTEVLQGPPEFNGLSTIPLITTQGFKQSQLLIGSLRNDDDTGKLASATLKFEQIDSGLTTPILKKTTTPTYQTWTTPTWISSLKTFLHNMRAEIIIPGQWLPTLQRENDISIMCALETHFPKHTKLHKQMNRCRKYLQMITLSDITDASGASLCPYTHKGVSHPHRKTRHHWPNQGTISMKHWRNWTRTISNLFTHDGTNLYAPLKNWLTVGTESQHWISYRDPESNHLYLQPTQQDQQ